MDKTRGTLPASPGPATTLDRGRLVQALWLLVSGSVLIRWWCPARIRVAVLRAFGADIGDGVLVRHRVRIHWPWKLTVGDNSWIGEGAWILNLEPVVIGANVCISQDVFLCTGSHQRSSQTFEFDSGPIKVHDGAWVAPRPSCFVASRLEQAPPSGPPPW